ncbi:MAG: ACP S-malonyltransferase [Saprospiraceae bacterium]|nr:ACP S-malonyltransferase [Saprospiraceae bacterium]
MKAFLFPGQGAQFVGMGMDLYETYPVAKELFDKANQILGFNLTQVMFEGSSEDLIQTKITQPAIFLHSVISAKVKMTEKPDIVAGHSLGEFSALVANGTLNFEDALMLVSQRAQAMQKSCDETKGTMAAIMTSDINLVEDICNNISDIVVPANYNTPSQLVISGSISGIQKASKELEEKGARVIPLSVGGAFHSPLMDSAKKNLQEAIEATTFSTPFCPIYQNVTAEPTTDITTIRANLINQLTGSVRWSQTIQNMMVNNVSHFVEVGGKGRILLGMVRKINRKAQMEML